MVQPTVSNRFVLKFNSDTGKVARIGISRACMEKDMDDVKASMDALIATGILMTSNGAPNGIHGVKRITTQRTRIMG